MDIGRVNSNNFDLIFYEMSYFVRNYNTLWNFGNRDVIEYFSNNENKIKWKTILSNLNEDEQLIIRDYYRWLLHTASDQRFQTKTYYVPTTLDSEMCENYAYGNDVDGGPVALIYFIPNPFYKYATNFESLFEANHLLKYYSLPVINSEMYPDEFEISIKGGLFPHFIVGIYEYNDSRFVLNHHFFKKENHKILKFGIDIDQSSFYQHLNKTNYKSGVGIFTDGKFTKIEI